MAARYTLFQKLLLSSVWLASFVSVALIPQAFVYGQNSSSNPSYPASLTMTPATISTTAGQMFTVNIQLDTGGHTTDGTRAAILYDKNLLSLTQITPGSIYSQYPSAAQSIDDSTGTAKVSGIADTGPTFSGSGTFATLQFTAKGAGTASINFDFQGVGVTTDSNVADTATSTDILGSVTGSTVTITGSAVGGPTQTIAPRNTLPNTATVNPTIVLASVGSGFVLLGVVLFFVL